MNEEFRLFLFIDNVMENMCFAFLNNIINNILSLDNIIDYIL